MRNLAIGADHSGVELKQQLVEHLKGRGLAVTDVGTFGPQAVDYPTIAQAVAERVARGECQLGVMIDGAGIGSAMAANKVRGVRAALCYDLSSARNSREHNNANVLTLGARLIGPDLARQIVDAFVDTECTAERHLRRVAMIDEIERQGRDGAAAPAASGAKAGGGAPTSEAELMRAAAQGSAAAGGAGGGDLVLSEGDWQRVADRVAALLAGAAGGQSPCGVAPDHTGCGFCRSCADLNPELVRKFIGLGADRIVHRGDGQAVPADIAAYIDHTLLRPDGTYEQITKLCKEAAEYRFASVCVNPCHVARCAKLLKGTPVRVCTVVGFPLGATTAETKALEARRAIREGASEIDMVINVGALKSGDDELVYRDIRQVVEVCLDGGAILKVIIEAALLNNEEKERACLAARRARADFVKTSTGFGPGGATAEDVALMSRAVAGTKMGVKAAGGIRNLADAKQMILAGATRIGASAGVRIVKESQGVTVSGGGDKY